MKKRIVLILLLFPALLFAQNKTDDQGRKQGEWSKKYENGKTRYRGTFKDGKPIGKFLYWYANGEPQTVLTYSVKGHEAHCITYGPDRVPSARGKYVDQLKDSTWVFFDYEGRTRSKNNYKDGLLDGEQITYNYKGKLMEVALYKDDKKHGKQVQFYNSGQIKLESYWDMGFPSGKITAYQETGGFEMRGQYKLGKKNGYWRHYNSKGKEEKKVYYRYGQLLEGKAYETYMENLRKLKAEGKDIDQIEKEIQSKNK
jgi:antitoxin component YwqK of YwqJK toxin-antitoxin module